MDTTVGIVLGFVYGTRSIKTARYLFIQVEDLPPMDYGTDFLKSYEHRIPKALDPKGKTFDLITI